MNGERYRQGEKKEKKQNQNQNKEKKLSSLIAEWYSVANGCHLGNEPLFLLFSERKKKKGKRKKLFIFTGW